jgi:Abi-like protein
MAVAVVKTMSKRRFETYLHAAGYNEQRALNLYLWNAKLGASFHIPIQVVEVSLRNRVNHALMSEFGQDWWKDERFISIIDRERMHDLEVVKTRISKKKLTLDTDQIVAGLSFGFWVSLMHKKYNPSLWGKHLQSSFSDLPVSETRQRVFELGGQISRLRNRISHHEPLLRTNVLQEYSDMLMYISWLCPDTAIWVKPHCDVPKIVRQKP